MKGVTIMTTNNSRAKLYTFYDSVTAGILDRWAERYAEQHKVSYDYALVVILLEVNTHKRSIR